MTMTLCGLRAGSPVTEAPIAEKLLRTEIHPRECIDDHQVDETAAQNLLYEPAEEVRCIELSFGDELNPGNEDLDKKEREEQLEGIGLDGCAVFRACGVKLRRDVVESHDRLL